MSSPGSPTLIIDTSVRRTETAAIASTLVCGALAPWLVISLSVWMAALLSGLAAAVLWLAFVQAGWRGRREIVRVSWTAEGRWLLTLRNGAALELLLDSQTRVGAHLVWLRWRTGGVVSPRRSRLLSSLDLAPADLRRLRARLRLEPGAVQKRAMPAVVAV
jgi:hypothetical protein